MNTQCSIHSTSTAWSTSHGCLYPAGSTVSATRHMFVYLGGSTLVHEPLVSHTGDDLSWAYSPQFEHKLEVALLAVEAGDFDSVATIDELIEYIDAQGKKTKI